MIPLLVGDDSQQVQGIRVVRLRIKNLTIQPSGMLKKTALVLL
jgi:hypothetical protein